MEFFVKEVGFEPEKQKEKICYLVADNWNDYYCYKTMYDLYFCTSDKVTYLGKVKIGKLGLGRVTRDKPFSPFELGYSFSQLTEEYFSLGEDVEYYQKINEIPHSVKLSIFSALRDIAFNSNLISNVIDEDITHTSIMRGISEVTVRGQFNRVITGGALLTEFDFGFTYKNQDEILSFKVIPNQKPPSNVQVLIGRNGVGKTHILYKMLTSIFISDKAEEEPKYIFTNSEEEDVEKVFPSVVGVSFSAFDYMLSDVTKFKNNKIKYEYIGLMNTDEASLNESKKELDGDLQFNYFLKSIKVINGGMKRLQWNKAIDTLETDEIFSDIQIRSLTAPKNGLLDEANLKKYFEKLSSGHKIILLIITKLVETVEEKTLVLIDEPENHLHPPLLSAFTRALSDLLVHRNGVAIIATHSPVILQEVPRDCAWVLNRSGEYMSFFRPEIETFGENTGVLTRTVFKLEVTKSGYHRLIEESVNKNDTIEEVYEEFSNKLGFDARLLARQLMHLKNDGDSNE